MILLLLKDAPKLAVSKFLVPKNISLKNHCIYVKKFVVLYSDHDILLFKFFPATIFEKLGFLILFAVFTVGKFCFIPRLGLWGLQIKGGMKA